jgi:hypothetical protein
MLKKTIFVVIASPVEGGTWQSIFTKRLFRRFTTCGTPRPAKAGLILQKYRIAITKKKNCCIKI